MPVATMSRTACWLMSNGNSKKQDLLAAADDELGGVPLEVLVGERDPLVRDRPRTRASSSRTRRPRRHALGPRRRAVRLRAPAAGRRRSRGRSAGARSDQIRRPAGRIQGNQSGIRLGIGPVVLRAKQQGWTEAANRFPITLSDERAHRGVVGDAVAVHDRVRFGRATMHDARRADDAPIAAITSAQA